MYSKLTTALQCEEVIKAQQEFISILAHEFKTPLSAIEGSNTLLGTLLTESAIQRREVAEKTQRWLGLQSGAIQMLKELVDKILSLSKIDHLAIEPSLHTVHPAAVFQEIVQRFNDGFALPRIRLTNDIPESFACVMDPTLMRCMIDNLLSNALKYSDPQAIVYVSTFATKENWGFDVRDAGRGIPKEDQKSLFRPFFRGRNVGIVPGSGLGLLIVKRAIDLHRGAISFNSDEQGTQFVICIPVDQGEPRESVLTARNPST